MTLAAGGLLRLTYLAAALATGCMMTLLLYLNSELALHGGPMFASWTAHGTGMLAGLVLLLVWRQARPQASPTRERAPVWAYMGGFTGAVNVMLGSSAVNLGLAITGTQAIGLSGQMLFSLAADKWGLLGLPRRRLGWRDLVPALLIVSGSLVIILFGVA